MQQSAFVVTFAVAAGLIAASPAVARISIDGKAATEVRLETIRTPTGSWPVYDLGPVTEGRAYRFAFEQRPGWYSICIVRAPDGDGDIDERLYRVGTPDGQIDIRALPGSMKCAETDEPVRPSMERVRAAIAAGRVLPYSAAAFRGWGHGPRNRPAPVSQYRPDRIYGRSGMQNAIGAVTGAGGEYPSSRGFLAGTDAEMIAAAVEGDPKRFERAARQARVETLYGLSLPNLVIWSMRHHMLRDPQIPLGGDRAYANEGRAIGMDSYGDEGRWTAPADYPYLAEIDAEAGKVYSHRRDQAHLFNHGYVYWLATGDPRAAMLQQAIKAYSLASSYRRAPGRYVPRFGYQRTTLNQFNAAWKLRDVARNVSTTNSRIFWPRARSQKMIEDLWSGWERDIARLDRSASPYDRSVAIFRGIDANADDHYNAFMMQAYGPEAAYLWASAGQPQLLRRIAENMVLRFGRIGGARGYYGAGKGSGFPVLAKGAMPYRDQASFIDWVNANSQLPSDRFDNTPIHYTIRSYWTLRMAADATTRGWISPVSDLMPAIERMEAARDNTGRWAHIGVLGWKHAGVPFDDSAALKPN